VEVEQQQQEEERRGFDNRILRTAADNETEEKGKQKDTKEEKHMRSGGERERERERERILESMVDVWDPQKVVGCRMTRFAREFSTENSLQDAISMPVCLFILKIKSPKMMRVSILQRRSVDNATL
jgi:hypothetical protein